MSYLFKLARVNVRKALADIATQWASACALTNTRDPELIRYPDWSRVYFVDLSNFQTITEIHFLRCGCFSTSRQACICALTPKHAHVDPAAIIVAELDMRCGAFLFNASKSHHLEPYLA